MNEDDERLPRGAKGDKGDAGEKGDRGQRGLTARVAYAIIALFLIAFLIAGSSLLLTSVEIRRYNAKLAAEQAAQEKAGEQEIRALCTDLGTMARIPPPPGPAAANPSRAYEQSEHRAWQGLYSSIRCPKT